MEAKNHKVIRSFVSEEDSRLLIKWIEGINHYEVNANHHLTELAKELNGTSHIVDVSKTKITGYITDYQKVTESSEELVPTGVYYLINRISETLGLPVDHVFFQAVDMRKGGKISPHYDASVEGYVNYKCNLCLLSEDYDFFVGDETVQVQQGDLYCFEASLYKHWTNTFDSRRVFISFGFMVPYEVLGRSETDPRVRLSRRIEKYFQR